MQGYRDASCLFMEMMVKKDTAASNSSYHEPTKSDYCLCLVIHAPRKGIVEVVSFTVSFQELSPFSDMQAVKDLYLSLSCIFRSLYIYNNETAKLK